MNISAISPVYHASNSTSTTPTNTTNSTAASTSTDSTDSLTKFLTPNDISTLERLYGESSVTDLEADPNAAGALSAVNNVRKNGFQGDITTFFPEANLTSSDVALLEQTTGTTSINAAIASGGSDAISLMMNISDDRRDGSLKGDVTTGYLQNLLGVSEQMENAGQYGNLASSAFLKSAISDVQDATEQSSGSTVSATV